MPRKKYQPRSVFFSLPQEIKRNLRAQPKVEAVADISEDEDSPGPSSRRDLLSTQPPADDSASEGGEEGGDEAESSAGPSSVGGLSGSGTPALVGETADDSANSDDGDDSDMQMDDEEEGADLPPLAPQVSSTLGILSSSSSSVLSSSSSDSSSASSSSDSGSESSASSASSSSAPSSSAAPSAPGMSAPTPPIPTPTTVVLSKRHSESTDLPPSKRRKGKGRADDNPYAGHPWDCTGLVPRYTDMSQVPKELKKYFAQRHSLFPAYSRLPLLMDDTGWFSVTPAAIAEHIAERCRSDVILDAFCGVGGNAIAFAQTCDRVIAMDNDPVRLRLARHNALHHGVADRIEFVLCDYVAWARAYTESGAAEKEHIDVVFLSPPWGGPEYLSFGDDSPLYPLSAVEPIPGDELFRLTAKVTPNIAYFLPRNVDVDELGVLAEELAESVTEAEGERDREWVEVEEEWVGDKLKAVTAYYGALVAEA